MYICPICRQNLNLYEKTYKCENNHCYDVAKQGYVNLLSVNSKHTLCPGDNELMVGARSKFLQKGYYKNLADAVTQEIMRRFFHPTVVDAGCSEGYYLNEISKKTDGKFYGFDISKSAVKCASSAHKNAHFSVASVTKMPYKDCSTDVILRIFAPYCEEEYSRVLKEDGIVIQVTPGKEHLIELKKLLYSEAYLNDENKPAYKNFEKLSEKRIKYAFCTESGEDNFNLFTMTPYYYKTPKERAEKISLINSMQITADFVLEVYAKRHNF